ncbi:hypothetical protein QE435_000250 [Rhizobium sp. SORGH_AS 787]|uniref:Uncharacterized protein n=1 Tax=Agrobacterium larrymoorei TaxID=160699 RepID=A0ABU0UHQ9_9HYPH|nr:hypothetical protein [Agrobacterium larrymoorei]MDQ1194560.1 hypothetical protein [Rhizobium sp. SORGH_AS_0787]
MNDDQTSLRGMTTAQELPVPIAILATSPPSPMAL